MKIVKDKTQYGSLDLALKLAASIAIIIFQFTP